MPEYQGQSTITIEAPIDRVYAYLADFRKHPEWAKNLSKVTQVTPGPIAVGTVFKTQEGVPPVRVGQKVKMMMSFMQGLLGGAKPYSEATITALESPGCIAWQAGIPKGAGFFNFAEWEFVLEALGNATHLTQRFHWKPQTPTAERMVSAAGVEGLENAVAVNLTRLKRRLEISAREH
jgi:uncharacterized membrane protein